MSRCVTQRVLARDSQALSSTVKLMARKKPASAKQRKAQLQLKRAVKRGDVEPEQLPQPKSRRHLHSRSAATTEGASSAIAAASARRLQSAFVKLSPALLERSKVLAARVHLTRPVPSAAAVWSVHSGRIDEGIEGEMRASMSCMRRPKWRYEMTKKEVEKNEEGVFSQWLAKTDAIVEEWVKLAEEDAQSRVKKGPDEEIETEGDEMPKSPTIFERNLEVWRQLWRVTELSQILLILLDSRCPLLHIPASLSSYLSTLPQTRLILVLTKVDISGPERANAWDAYLRTRYPTARVVQVEAYIQTASSEGATERKRRFEPHIPQTFKERLVQTLKEVHQGMLVPPERIRDDEAKVKNWKPRVKLEVDWDAVLKAGPKSSVPRDGRDHGVDEALDDDEAREPDYLTIGLIGQPNVGKSSLLNALFGTTKVRASKTPGKTKHFQTLFWTPDIRLVDCPGLVMPDLVPLEMQVLSGILPIARMPALPLCIAYAAQLLPLERILGLMHPSTSSPAPADKRTWREGSRQTEGTKTVEAPWTAMDVMSAYADKKGWVTAKAGRSDINRAGNASTSRLTFFCDNAVLRALAEGKIRWAFWPPGSEAAAIDQPGNGIWIPAAEGYDDDALSDSEDERDEEEGGNEDDDDGDDEEVTIVSSDEENDGMAAKFGRFALLGGDDADDDSNQSESGDDSDNSE
ncbi:P-loop containing nucleoside triphosphate hydrolase protein [Artomyces pyxidatus]|uniref:P-loop containing nucleoside triphosphate hydrolase protein n=1 Tax=Artomyces pyxidatus TaxID=48021 RepID=A0ACB8TI53_9AGAM|nr:P-loop containing nucleoside triphosphate hydrolase protein [Artomyces pyxidatus]